MIRIYKPLRQPHYVCCVDASYVLRAKLSTMEPRWSQFKYFPIQEMQFCLDLPYQDVLPSVSTKKRTPRASTRKSGTSKPTTPVPQQRPNQRSTSGTTSISCRHRLRRPRRRHKRRSSSISRQSQRKTRKRK